MRMFYAHGFLYYYTYEKLIHSLSSLTQLGTYILLSEVTCIAKNTSERPDHTAVTGARSRLICRYATNGGLLLLLMDGEVKTSPWTRIRPKRRYATKGSLFPLLLDGEVKLSQ